MNSGNKPLRTAVLIATCVVLLLVAGTGHGFGTGKYEGQTIVILGADHPGFNCLFDLIPEFEKLYGAKVKVDQVDQEAIWAKVALTKGTSNYDILMVDTMQVPELMKIDLLEPLNKYMSDPAIGDPSFDAKDVIPVYLQLFDYSGTLYGLPLSGETALYFYRKDLYKKYGRQPAKTIEDLIEDLKFFNKREPDLYGATWRGTDTYGALLLMWHYGGRFFENDDPHKKLVLNSKENLAAWRTWRDLMKWAPPGCPGFAYDQSATMFQQLKAAVYVDASNIQYLLDPSYSKLTLDKLGWAPIPLAKGVTKRESPACGWGLAVAKMSKHKEAAFKFIEFQLNKANDKLLTEKGRMPNRVSTCQDPSAVAKYPYLPVVLEILKDANAEFLPRIPESVEIWNLMSVAAREVCSGEKTPEKALDELQASVYSVMEEAGYYK